MPQSTLVLYSQQFLFSIQYKQFPGKGLDVSLHPLQVLIEKIPSLRSSLAIEFRGCSSPLGSYFVQRPRGKWVTARKMKGVQTKLGIPSVLNEKFPLFHSFFQGNRALGDSVFFGRPSFLFLLHLPEVRNAVARKRRRKKKWGDRDKSAPFLFS